MLWFIIYTYIVILIIDVQRCHINLRWRCVGAKFSTACIDTKSILHLVSSELFFFFFCGHPKVNYLNFVLQYKIMSRAYKL